MIRARIYNSGRSLYRLVQQHTKHVYSAIRRHSRYSIGYGKAFWETYDFLQKSQWWSRNKLEEYQMQQLSSLLHHAYQNVPYYTRVFDERSLKPVDIQTPDDLKKLPPMTKDDFRNHFPALVAVNMDAVKIPLGHTSGTSGKSLQFFTSWDIIQRELAFVFHQWSRVGFLPGDNRAEIRGPIINTESRTEFDPAFKVLRLSPRIDNKDVAQCYLDKIVEYKLRFIYGYPSSIACLAQYAKKYGLKVPSTLKAVMFASEVVYDWQREIVSEVFQCRAFSHYGLSEQAVIAGECENSTLYHCAPQYGITEFDPETEEIIGTSFLNNINPFIRYRTTDIASGISSHCGQCRRAYYPVFRKVEGRLGDYLVTPRGLIGPGIMIHPFKDLKTVRDTQIMQKAPDLIIVKVASWPDKVLSQYNAEIEFLKQSLHDILGHDMKIEVKEVEEIERQVSGKFKWITSDISGDLIEKGVKPI